MPDPLIALLIAASLIVGSALIFWPRHGLVARWKIARRATERTLTEDALKHLYLCATNQRRPTIQSVAGKLQIPENQTAELLNLMQQHGLVTINGDVRLTATGTEYALHMIRAHRLWERYLADQTGYAADEWHDQADEAEHKMSQAEVEALAATLGHPVYDPHGDPIPTAGGDMQSLDGEALTSVPANQSVRIIHLEDEPAAVYAQLTAEGLYPGMVVRTLERSDRRVRFWADGDEHVLAPIVAANITVKRLPVADELPVEQSLADLTQGETGRIVAISPRCRGAERRRLLDLGIVPGTVVEAAMISPSGDPTAYRVRDTLIALRKEQASLIAIDAVAQPKVPA